MTDSPSKNRLSVAVIVRDAAEPLRLTLSSMRHVAFEIVVVDTGSTDKTRDVAREFGARVVEFPWGDDFSAARNFAHAQVTGDWVLWLDAGETMNDADTKALREFVTTSADRQCGYMMLVRVPPVDPQATIEQIGRVRLVPHQPTLTFRGRVRESCTDAFVELGMRVAPVPFVIERGDREHDRRLKKMRANRNIRLAEREQCEQGFSARLWNCLGDGLQTLGDNRRAAECFQQALAIATLGSPDQLEAYYGLLTSSAPPAGVPVLTDARIDPNPSDRTVNVADSIPATEKYRDTQLTLCTQALEAFPLDAQLLCALAGYLHTRGHSQLAMQAYRMAYQFGQVEPTVWHIAEIRDVAAICYCVSLQLQNRGDDAIRFLEESLAENGESIKQRRHLIEAYVNGGQRDAALAHVSALPKRFPHAEAFRSAVRGACYAVQKNWLAAKAYLQTAYGHGCRDPLCFKWLATCLLASGEAEAARAIVEQWLSVEPRNPEPAQVLKNLTVKDPAPADRQIRVDRPAASLSGQSIALNFGPASRTASGG